MINNLKSKLLKSIKSKRINIFLLFLVMSFGILILTKLSKTYTNTIAFKVEKQNVPETDVIINDSVTILNISLKTKGFNFLKYYFNTPKIDLDFSNKINKTDSVYIWNNQTAFSDIISQFDKDIEILNVNPDTLWFRYDVNDIKKIPIHLNSEVKFNLGYDLLDNYSIQPDSIKIIGPKSILSEIEKIETDTLKLNDVYSDINEIVKLKIQKKNKFLKYTPEEVKITAKVEQFTEGHLKVPVEVINIPENIRINHFPKTVMVSYYTSLTNFKSVKNTDFKVECDFSKINSNQTYLLPKIVAQPKGVRNVKINIKQIEFIITE